MSILLLISVENDKNDALTLWLSFKTAVQSRHCDHTLSTCLKCIFLSKSKVLKPVKEPCSLKSSALKMAAECIAMIGDSSLYKCYWLDALLAKFNSSNGNW